MAASSPKKSSRRKPKSAALEVLMVPVWVAEAAFQRLVPTPRLIQLARLRGRFRYATSPSRRNRLIRDLGAVLPGADAEAVRTHVRNYFEYLQCRNLVQTWPYRIDSDRLANTEANGLQHVDEALGRGKGALIVTPHFGYARLIKHLLRQRGYTASTVGISGIRSPRSTLRGKIRDWFGAGMLDKSVDNELSAGINLRPLLQALARNEVILMTVDGKQSSQFVDVNLLGATVPYPTGSFQIARMTGTTVIPGFVVDNDKRLPRALLLEGRLVPPTATDDETASFMQSLADTVGQVVLQYPHLNTWRRLRNIRSRKGESKAERFTSSYLTRKS